MTTRKRGTQEDGPPQPLDADDEDASQPGLDPEDDLPGDIDSDSVDMIDGETMEIEPDLNGSIDLTEEAEEAVGPEEIPATLELADDPVRMYLKEIGRVELLESDHELWLTVRMESARRAEVIRAGRASRPKASEAHVAAEYALFADLRTAWKRVLEDSHRLRQPTPDLQLIVEEARQLRQTWQGDTPSYLRAWLDNGVWGTDPAWEQVARNAVNAFLALYLMPPIVQEKLSDRLAKKNGLPTRRTFQRSSHSATRGRCAYWSR